MCRWSCCRVRRRRASDDRRTEEELGGNRSPRPPGRIELRATTSRKREAPSRASHRLVWPTRSLQSPKVCGLGFEICVTDHARHQDGDKDRNHHPSGYGDAYPYEHVESMAHFREFGHCSFQIYLQLIVAIRIYDSDDQNRWIPSPLGTVSIKSRHPNTP